MPESGGLFGVVGHCEAGALQNVLGQTRAGNAPCAGGLIDLTPVVEGEKGLNLADDLAAGCAGVEHLAEETEEGAPHGVNVLAAVGALRGLCQKSLGQQRREEGFDLVKALLAEVLNAAAHGRKTGQPLRKEGSV